MFAGLFPFLTNIRISHVIPAQASREDTRLRARWNFMAGTLPANHALSQYTVQGPPPVFTSCTLLARPRPRPLHHRHRPILTSSPSYDPYIIGIARPFPTHQARGLFSLPDNTCQSPHSWHTGHLRLPKVVLGMGHLGTSEPFLRKVVP